MKTDNSIKYLSLKTAAELYGYTRDHLGLMIRQGRLKGTKLGSYYVVTNEWMIEYIKNFADSNHPVSKNKMSNKFLTEALSFGGKTNNNNHDDNLGKELSEELSLLSAENSYLKETEKEAYIGAAEISDNFIVSPSKKPTIEYPYIILPTRKMSNNERESILNKAFGKGNEADAL